MAGVFYYDRFVVSMTPCVAVVYDIFCCVLPLLAFGSDFGTGLGFLVIVQ